MDKQMIRALLAEDERTLAGLLQEVLLKHGIEILLAYDGEEAYRMYQEDVLDVLIVDVMMPKLDGYNLVRKIRSQDPLLPIIFLTARATEEDVLEGFDAGADDYLRKPFKTSELIARIRALTRRAVSLPNASKKLSEDDSVLLVGEYSYDRTTLILKHIDLAGRSVEHCLSHREGEILCRLIESRGQIVEARDILRDLWGKDDYYTNRSLHVFITRLRHYLSADLSIRITNIRTVGYKLVVKAI